MSRMNKSKIRTIKKFSLFYYFFQLVIRWNFKCGNSIDVLSSFLLLLNLEAVKLCNIFDGSGIFDNLNQSNVNIFLVYLRNVQQFNINVHRFSSFHEIFWRLDNRTFWQNFMSDESLDTSANSINDRFSMFSCYFAVLTFPYFSVSIRIAFERLFSFN